MYFIYICDAGLFGWVPVFGVISDTATKEWLYVFYENNETEHGMVLVTSVACLLLHTDTGEIHQLLMCW